MNKYRYRQEEPFDREWKIKKPNFLLSFIDFLDENNIWKFEDILNENLYKLKFVSNLFSIEEDLLKKYIDDDTYGIKKFPVF